MNQPNQKKQKLFQGILKSKSTKHGQLVPNLHADRFKNTEMYIEADNSNTLLEALKYFQETFLKSMPFKIVEDMVGYYQTIGWYGTENMCIILHFKWYSINGHRVCFYYPESILIHWDMIHEWMEMNIPNYKDNHSVDVYRLCRYIHNACEKKCH